MSPRLTEFGELMRFHSAVFINSLGDFNEEINNTASY